MDDLEIWRARRDYVGLLPSPLRVRFAHSKFAPGEFVELFRSNSPVSNLQPHHSL